jgi:hypothetical protein
MRNTTHGEIGRFAPVLSSTLTLLLAACANNPSIPPVAEPSPSPVDKRTACEKKFSERVDHVVTLTGKFSLSGKLGSFILSDDCEIYLRSDQGFDWNDDKYSRMEGKSVRVTGTLRYKGYPDTGPRPRAEARAPNHFYFDPRVSTIELNDPAKPQR